MNASTLTARTIVDGLIAHGVEHVVISPGSRSAPLAYALAAAQEAGRIEVHVRIDERVGAFTALGLARFGPAVVVTTSGTAAANLHPALLEARHSGLGLIAITADRPHEIRGVGANQTTEQVGMYGPQIPSIDLPAGTPPEGVRNHLARALVRALGTFGRPAPVHLNVAFRDPLVPEDAPAHSHPGQGHPSLEARRGAPEPVTVGNLDRAVVVAGDGAGTGAAGFASAAGLPLLAEPSSGARGGPTAIGPYQRVLAEFGDEVEHAIVFGRPTLSRPVSTLLGAAGEVTVIADSQEWVDVAGNATRIVAAAEPSGIGEPAWLEQWRTAAGTHPPGQDLGSRVLAHCLGAGQAPVMLGSSMTIRYADIEAPAGAGFTGAPVYASRGLAGIDGTISTATGIALANGALRVVLGDLTFAHDVGALALGPHERRADVQIVVLNDGGGSIFARLEHGQDRYAGTFERFFATPVDIDVEEIARAYGYDYAQITSGDDIERVLGPRVRGRSIVEVMLRKLSATSQVRGVNYD